MEKLFVNVDGASQGNPGEAAIGIVIADAEGNVIQEISEHIGRTTNNVAEYRALIEAIKAVIPLAPKRVIFLSASAEKSNFLMSWTRDACWSL
jgi:ribonuclease HI